MVENEDVMSHLAKVVNPSGILSVGEKAYKINSMSITKSTIPVRKPTTRGGVYFTDTEAYKIKASTSDLSISSEIPKLMLGPNADFKPLVVTMEASLGDKKRRILLTTHLTNTVNTSDVVELNLIVDKVDLA